jgi:transposase
VTCAVAEMGRSTFLWGPIMLMPAAQPETPAAIRVDLGAIFVSLELSKSTWLVTSLAPGSEKISRHIVTGGDTAGLFACFADLRKKAQARSGQLSPLVVIQEAGLDGFWIDRVLNREDWIESHVVDAASIAVPRRHRRVKTDRIDGETLIRTLMAYKRGEPRVCSMVRVPTPEEEDRRRLCRERKALVAERVLPVNRIRGLLFSQGIRDYKPLHRDRRKRLEELRTGDDRALSVHIKAQICRELDRLELLLEQIKAVDAERDVLVVEKTAATPAPAAMLLDIRGIGPEFAAVLHSEGLFRHFANRRQLAAYAGLAPSPWKSGSIDREQGVSKAGNPRLRTTMIQLAWLWLRHQPNSLLTRWFHDRVMQNGGRFRKVAVVALARKLLIALWKYATAGVVIEGAIMKHV